MPGGHSLLDQPCWIIVINMVTLDLLRCSVAQHPGRHSLTQPSHADIHYFIVMTLRPAMEIRCRPRLSIPFEDSKDKDQDRNNTRETSKADSLYYCGLQARIAPFVLAKQRDVIEGRGCS